MTDGSPGALEHGGATHLCTSPLCGSKSVRGLQDMFVGFQSDSAKKSMQSTTGRVCFARYISWWTRFAGSRRLGTNRPSGIWFGTLPRVNNSSNMRTASVNPLARASKARRGHRRSFGAQMPHPTSPQGLVIIGGIPGAVTRRCSPHQDGSTAHGVQIDVGKGEGTTVEKHAPTDDEHSGLVSVELTLRVGPNVGSQDSKCATPIARCLMSCVPCRKGLE